MTGLVMGQERIPDHLMSEARAQEARGFCLAQSIPPLLPHATEQPIPPSQTSVSRETPALAFVRPDAVVVSGRDWCVVQLDRGAIRFQGDETAAKAECRRLATEEGTGFALFQPRSIIRPVTQVALEEF